MGRTNAQAQSGGSGHNYSTTEHVIGTWINSKPIYEKTLEFTLDGDSYYNNDTDFTTVEQMLDFKGFINADYDGGIAAVAINCDLRGGASQTYYNNVHTYFVKNGNTENGLVIWGNKGNSADFTFANKSGCITVQYTKTTDTANS